MAHNVLISVNAVTTAPFVGAALVFDEPVSSISAAMSQTGATGGVDSTLQGSLDGVNFFDLPSNSGATPFGFNASSGGIISTGNHAVLAVRATVDGLFASGTATPTVTITVAGAG